MPIRENQNAYLISKGQNMPLPPENNNQNKTKAPNHPMLNYSVLDVHQCDSPTLCQMSLARNNKQLNTDKGL